MQTHEAKLVFKYRMLDYSLTKLIKEQESILQYPELLKEGIKIFKPQSLNDYSKYEEIFKFYYLNFKLKDKVRSGWDNRHWNVLSDRIERISEHVVGTIALVIALDSEVGRERKLEIDKVIKTLVIHEIGEILIGDITPFDGITVEQKKKIEHKAMIDVIGNLSNKNELLDLLFDFDEQFSNEAKFAYFCDKIEADLQSKIYQDSGLHHSLDDQSNNCVFKSAKVQKMLDNGAQTAFDIWYEWDVDIFKNNDVFPEFSNILNVIKDNDIFTLDKTLTLELKK